MTVSISSQAFGVNIQTNQVPQRVVSINLCTDELAIQLAKPGQLRAVTFLVKDPMSSIHWKSAKSFNSHNNSLEQIVSYKPDLILASQYTSQALLIRLKQLGFTIYVLPIADSLQQVNANIIAMGRRLGNEILAKQMVAKHKNQIDSIRKRLNNQARQLDVVIYLPGGLSHSGKGLTSRLIKMAGMRNMAVAKGYDGWRSLSIEQLLRWNPDLLVVIQSHSESRSLSSELFHHPAIQYFQKQKRVVNIPVQWLSCGSPSTAKIIARLISSRRLPVGQNRK